MKNKLEIIAIFFFLMIQNSFFGQANIDLIGYWQSEDVSTRFYGFTEKQAIRFSIYPKEEIVDSYYIYGFCDKLKLSNINNLKDEGVFYFEVDASDFDEKYKDKDGTYHGIQANVIQMDDDKNRFQMYDPARPGQRGTYKRIKQLPPQLASILKSKGIVINPPKKDSKKALSIKSQKSIIYSEPNKPSKMFLLKGDTVTVLQEKDNWVCILYLTSKGKEIKGWIKKEDISSN